MQNDFVSDDAPVRQQREDGLLLLRLARPQRGNALDPHTVEAIRQALQRAAEDLSLQMLALQAEGRNFCTGFDLFDAERCSDGDLLHRFVQVELMLAALWRAGVSTAAHAQGRAWGAGADLFCAVDERWASPDATFRFPGAQFGLVLGTRRLAQRVGPDLCRRWIRSGAQVSAQQALEAGLVTRIGGADEFSEYLHAQRTACRIDRETLQQIHAASRPPQDDADLAALVRSATRPGLSARIAAYRAAMSSSKP